MTRQFPRLYVLVLVGLLLCLAATPWSASAQQTPAQPVVDPTCPYVLKTGIPFAWLRFQPSSVAGFGVTLSPGQTVTLTNPPTMSWDGVQWWIYVWPNAAPGVHGYYWVEINSLEPRCYTPPTPTPIPASGVASWSSGNVVRVRQSVLFVWFRAAPAPGNSPIYTVLPGTQLVIVEGAQIDSYNQWWWLVRDPRNGVTGWVEQNTVELVSGQIQPVSPSQWVVGDTVRVRLTIGFSWLRYTPGSTAGVVYTARSGQELILQQPAVSDGVQLWWKVGVAGAPIFGWVEQNSLEFVRSVIG